MSLATLTVDLDLDVDANKPDARVNVALTSESRFLPVGVVLKALARACRSAADQLDEEAATQDAPRAAVMPDTTEKEPTP